MNEVLWTVPAMVEALQARVVGTMPEAISGLSIDSRSIANDEAYFAIKGDVHDGHKFVAAAHAQGGAVSVVSEEWVERLGPDCGPLLVVDDVVKLFSHRIVYLLTISKEGDVPINSFLPAFPTLLVVQVTCISAFMYIFLVLIHH